MKLYLLVASLLFSLALLIPGRAFASQLPDDDTISISKQYQSRVSLKQIQCKNPEHKIALRNNGNVICGTEKLMQRLSLVEYRDKSEPLKIEQKDDVLKTKSNEEFTFLNVASPVEFNDDGREIKRSILQKSSAPWVMFDTIMDSKISPDSIGSDGLLRVPNIPHEKYFVSVEEDFFIEDWMPTRIPDGYRLLYANTDCHVRWGCDLKFSFVPNSFVLHKNVTNFDLDISKGFSVYVKYSPTTLNEIEDGMEELEEIFSSQSGYYGGYRDMMRDGTTVSAFEGGTDYNHYRASLSYYFDDYTRVGVLSFYHTIDELLPIFNSIGN